MHMKQDKSPPALTISGKMSPPAFHKDYAECNRLFDNKDYNACYDIAKKLLATTPNHQELQLSFAKVLIKLGKYDPALAILNTQLNKKTATAMTYSHLSDIYRSLNKPEEALSYAKIAVEKEPNNSTFHCNLAIIYYDSGAFDQALYHYKEGAKLGALYRAETAIGFTLLAMRRYQEGWAAYESRFKAPGAKLGLIQLNVPFWDGKTTLEGKNLLISWEQGVGDNIQFLRFLPLLKQRFNPNISFACGSPFVRLCQQFLQIDNIITNTPDGKVLTLSQKPDERKDIDLQISLLSLPFAMQINHENEFPLPPYIHAEKKFIEKWEKQLSNHKKYRVGVCWQGRVDYTHSDKRNCPLRYFLELLAYPAIELVSLQVNIVPEDQEMLDYTNITQLTNAITDFCDTAAIIASLDLVITVDTAVAHLAGAMGKPVWTLIRYETEWRHPRDCDVSPWYPNMRLFRQASPGDWNSVFLAVHQALTDLGHTQGT